MLEPSLPLHLQATWNYNSAKVGLVYMAALVPALICDHLLLAYDSSAELTLELASPLAGLLADRLGSNFITFTCLLLSLPWWVILALRKSVALFIVAIALQSEHHALAFLLFLMYLAFRFLCFRGNSSGDRRTGNRRSGHAGRWMHVLSSSMDSLADHTIL